ncbi:MAG: hypothetical protein QXU79_01160 [Candidatus Micrarchaeaceae archaeon]
MFSFKVYWIALRLLTPMHIGWIKVGNLQRTRPYVTGKALWGALTARLTRDGGTGNYQQIGQEVNQWLAFSYFYPSTDTDGVALWPWADPDEFAWLYLNTYASTALNYGQNSAEEGSLHETEYLSPYTREGEPVYLLGYIFARDGNLAWLKALGRLQLGGERGYGWGRVALASQKDWDIRQPLFGQWAVQAGTWPPELRPTQDRAKVLAHALAADFDDGTVRRAVSGIAGPVEPLVGRETVAGDRFGGQLSPARICHIPGSQVVNRNLVCRIGPYGIWEAGDGC